MSSSWTIIFPILPIYFPTQENEESAVTLIRFLFSEAVDIQVFSSEQLNFIDAGANWSTTRCTVCHCLVDYRWWSMVMEIAYKSRFSDLSVVMPCCGEISSLNQLDYDWPQGFSRWRVEILEPNRPFLSVDEIQVLGILIGCPVRLVYRHL